MRKIIYYTFIIIILIFLIPIIFLKRKTISTISTQAEEKNTKIKINEYNYTKYATIKLLHQDINEVEEVKLDEYIACVVSAEMPVSYDIEALKAQAVVARTYTIYKIETVNKHENADICDKSTCCQAWINKEDRIKKWKQEEADENWNKILKAVNETVGEIITYNEKPINAFFHANSGGKTEIPFNVWGGSGYPYLQVVETSGEDAYSQYSSELIISKEEFISKIKEKYNNFEINFKETNCIEIIKRDESDRIVTIKIGNLNLSGVEVRTALGLRSANFNVELLEDKLKFSVIGYGHGVGMSQTGADSLAKQGKKYNEIIKHYYSNVEIKKMD